MVASTPARTFVPGNFDAADFAQIEPLFNQLLHRSLNSAAELERWLLDASELASVLDEYGSRRYIDKSCHTEDPEIEKRFMHFVEEIEPKTKPLTFELQKRYLACPFRAELTSRGGKRLELLDRAWKAEVELFREKNIPLETEVTRLVTDYDKINGAMMVTFEGKELTLQQVAKFFEVPDRKVREDAWLLTARRRQQDRGEMDAIFDKLLDLRSQIAVNAGEDNYRSYAWKSYKRFDYTPDDCIRFGDAIAEVCVPLVDELDRLRRADMGLDALRPWDLGVDPQGRAALRPFTEEQSGLLVDKVKTIVDRLSPPLAKEFESLRLNNNLDLQSRKGKQPGGYQCSLNESRQPFIFMNAAGVQRDVETLLHEGGHAFHCLATADEPLVYLRSAPMEFCEVASMSMELLGSEHFDVFYPAADAARAKRSLIEGIIDFLPWMATIDLFQHWLYTRPRTARLERTDHWLGLLDRFGRKVDWSGLEDLRASSWQRQLHLFHAPFYYIEYGIAQLGALQLWMKAKEDPRRALANYQAALALGGTRPLPDLFAAAGIRFDFSTRTLQPLMDALRQELAQLPR